MRKSRVTESQIVEILKQGEGDRWPRSSGSTISARPHTFRWRAKYAGASVAELKRLKELAAENTKLKRMYAELRQPVAAPTRLNGTCALDFMADALYDGRPFWAPTVIDDGQRGALAVEIGSSIPSVRVIRVLDEFARFYGRPARVRLDNGPELVAEAFVEW